MNFSGKKVLVAGMAASGISAAKLMKGLGADVIVSDIKTRPELEEQSYELESCGIRLLLGEQPDSIVTEQDLIVVSPGLPTDLSFFDIARRKGIKLIGEIELAYMFAPCRIVAITGTNGKTTTTSMLGEMLAKKYADVQVLGNIGIPFTRQVSSLTRDSVVVLEMSSFQLETIRQFSPHIGAILNITPDHLDRHKTLRNYIKIKERIFENQRSDDFCILNYDDEAVRDMATKMRSKPVFFSYATKPPGGGVYFKDGKIYAAGKDAAKDDIMIVEFSELKIFGRHNAENAMAASAVALSMGVEPEDISAALKAFNAVEHRIEFVDTIDNVDFFNSSKDTNPDSAICALRSMSKAVVLIGGGYDKGGAFDDWVAEFEGRVKHCVLLGETTGKIIEAMNRAGFNSYVSVGSIEQAVDKAFTLADEGDCVLLSPACASWDMFKSFEDRGKQFKEQVYKLKLMRA